MSSGLTRAQFQEFLQSVAEQLDEKDFSKADRFTAEFDFTKKNFLTWNELKELFVKSGLDKVLSWSKVIRPFQESKMNNTFKRYLAEAKMEKPRAGKAYGTTDQAAPEKYTPEQLSRLTDAMYNAQEAGLDYKEVFKLAPDAMKLEWNYSKWKYVA